MAGSDRERITQAARDYIESWVTGDAERMRRCLHPRLAKRSLADDPTSGQVEEIGADDMVRWTREGRGTRHPAGAEIEILDVSDDIASVKVTSAPYVDLLHLARFGDAWLIVNVLWRPRDGYTPH